MSNVERVTVTLPIDLLKDIDRREKNRGKFVVQAIRHELARRRRADLRLSLCSSHPESAELAQQGFDEWVRVLPVEDIGALVDSSAGKAIRWIPGEGWVESLD